jgi:hypothetical protein
MMTRDRRVLIGYTVVNVYIVTTALRLFHRSTSLAIVSLFFLIPFSGIVLWFLNRRCRGGHSRPAKAYLVASRTLLVIAWLLSCLPTVLWIGVTQPWPLTLRHGPDTEYSRQGFARLIGITPPASVSNIYYRADEGFLDSGYRLRFTCKDSSVVSHVAARLQLQATDNPTLGLLSTTPKWWAEKLQPKGILQYARELPGKYYWYLWYDPTTGTVWYEEFSV